MAGYERNGIIPVSKNFFKEGEIPVTNCLKVFTCHKNSINIVNFALVCSSVLTLHKVFIIKLCSYIRLEDLV